MLEKMYNTAKKQKLDIVVCDSVNVYEDGREEYIKSNLNYSNNNIKNYLNAHPMACVRLFKKELFDFIKFKKNIYYEDLELSPKMVKYTKKVGFVNEGLYYYRQRSGSIMKQKQFNDRVLDIFDVLESNKKILEKEYFEEIEYMYITHLLRTATLRFLSYENNRKYIKKIRKIMKNEFPKWRKNIYYKKSSKKLKIICNLAYLNQIKILEIIKKKTNK